MATSDLKDMALDKEWMKVKDRTSSLYLEGVDGFLKFASIGLGSQDTIRCPCCKCKNTVFKVQHLVRFDLLKNGVDEDYTIWHLHGEEIDDAEFEHDGDSDSMRGNDDDMVNMLQDACGVLGMDLGNETNENDNDNDEQSFHEQPTAEANKFYRLLKDYEEPLTFGGSKISKLSYIVKLLHLKCLNHWSDNAFDSLLRLQNDLLGLNPPSSYYEAKKVTKDLGHDCVEIHACGKDCIIYWGHNKDAIKCPTCDLSRWTNDGKNLPHKVLRYFPLKPRLQRLYMSSKTAKDMCWHKEECVEDGVMRHPADSIAWKSFDEEYKSFADDPRNVRLGLASNGFQPFKDSQYSIWPVVLVPYNLPPWKCMKPYSFMLSLLVPGPNSPGINLDVYLQPLIDELKELWEIGVETYDSNSKVNFIMHAALLWTISDFPAYGDLSGWTTKGNFACPNCHKDTQRRSIMHKGCFMCHRRWLPQSHRWRKDVDAFDKTVEKRDAPTPLSGDEVLEHFKKFDQCIFGKGVKRKRGDSTTLYGWKKQSTFFNLPYWHKLKLRHNLDVMHIEKNVSDAILGTLMNIKGKTKDTLKARLDLINLNIRSELHPILDGDKVHIPIASYTLSRDEKNLLCDMFANLRSPDGYLSNISRCVKDNGKKISCMKSHDHHVFLEQLLPLAITGLLPKNVCDPLIELSSFFRNLCSKSLTLKELDVLERQIPYTLCKLEMVFPPAFFDVMVHLVVHLATEAKIGGPVQYRWMYPIERYLRTLKAYIRNRARPEGSIATGYLADECLTFCSRYMNDIDTKFNRRDRNCDHNDPSDSMHKLEIFKSVGRPLGKATSIELSMEEFNQVHLYVLNNCDDLVDLAKEHKVELHKDNPCNVEQRHNSQFAKWLRDHVERLRTEESVSDGLYDLVCYPSRIVRSYRGYIVNGYRFHTIDREKNRKCQNSGVMVRGDDDIEYYGRIRDIYELCYAEGNHIFTFKCDWYDVEHHGRGYKKDKYGLVSLNIRRSLKTNDPFVLESQIEQVFYVQDPKSQDWQYVIKTQPRDLYNMPSKDANQVVEQDASQQEESSIPCHMFRMDADTTTHTLSRNSFMTQRETNVINMVKKTLRSVRDEENDSFINDGETEGFEEEEEEEEDDINSYMSDD